MRYLALAIILFCIFANSCAINPKGEATATGNKGVELSHLGIHNDIPIDAQVAGDAKGLEVHSEGGIGLLWLGIAGFAACTAIATAGFTAIVRAGRRKP